jgi:putative DNA primase/helicase
LQRAGFNALADAPSMQAVLRVLHKFGASLREVDPLTAHAAGIEATGRLTELGIMGAKGLVERALALSGTDRKLEPNQGRSISLDDAEPWLDPVDGADLLNRLSSAYTRYVVLPSAGCADALALWTVHTYLVDTMMLSPVLAITSPEKRCGKTTLMLLIGALARRPLLTSNVTAAALFRSIEKHKPTLLVDEADTLFEASPELRGIYNAGHIQSTAFTMRCVGDDHEPRKFSTFCPKVLAKIGSLPETIEDRSIPIKMCRKLPGDHLERLRQDRIHAEMADLRSQMRRWALDWASELSDDPAVPGELHDRAQDNWRPLLAIAELAGGDWPARAKAAALELSAPTDDTTTSHGVLLLTDLQALFENPDIERLSSDQIVRQLTEMDEHPWAEFLRGKPITSRRVAELLRPFGVHPRTIRFGEGTRRGYERSSLEDAFARYLSPRCIDVADVPEAEGPMNTRSVALVADGRAPVAGPVRRPTIKFFRAKRPIKG